MSALKQSFVVMLKSNESWATQLAKVLGNKKYLTHQQIDELAVGVVEVFDCYVGTGTDGGYRFYKTEEAVSANRHDGAQKAWERHVAKYHNIKRSNRGGVRKQVDVVDASRRKAEKFAEAHGVAEIRNEIKAVEAYLKSLKAYV
jgi:hypothetical protein